MKKRRADPAVPFILLLMTVAIISINTTPGAAEQWAALFGGG